jgi:hypothetical protein
MKTRLLALVLVLALVAITIAIAAVGASWKWHGPKKAVHAPHQAHHQIAGWTWD